MMIIAQISDTHIALDTPDSDRRIRDFEKTIADINALDPAPDVVIHTGDIVQNGLADEYAEAARIIRQCKFPVYLMVGNKDDRAQLRAAFPDADYLNQNSEFISYVIEGFPLRLIALDTLKIGSRKGDFCQKRIADFEATVAADPEKPIAVFAHHPPFLVDQGPEPMHFDTRETMDRFCQTLLNAQNITNLYCAHVHRSIAGNVGPIPALIMTAVATPLRWGDIPENLKTLPMYYVHEYDAKWGMTSRLQIVEV